MRAFLGTTLGTTIALAILTSAPGAAAQHAPPPPSPAAATPEGRSADIAAFRSDFLKIDRSYSPQARAEAERRLAALEPRAATLSAAAFELELSRIVALADNGHTWDFAGPRAAHFNSVPFHLGVFGEDFYVLRASAANADLLGARIVAIDGHPIAEVRATARSLVGGTAGHRDHNIVSFYESPEQLAALGMASAADHATYRFQTPAGVTIERQFTAGPPNGDYMHVDPTRWYFPQPTPSETGVRTALSPERAPWSLTEPEALFRWRAAPEIDGLVVEFRSNVGNQAHSIQTFLAEARAQIDALHPRNIVIDERFNGGGDLNTTRDFLQALPTLVPGRIFVLTSPATFSAAISSTGYLKQAAPDRVSIVGEMVGDRPMFFAEGRPVVLPNSHAMILFATERHDYQKGCRDYSDCHGNVVRHPIAVPTLAPDISAPWTIEAYLAGRDPGMEAVAAALASH